MKHLPFGVAVSDFQSKSITSSGPTPVTIEALQFHSFRTLFSLFFLDHCYCNLLQIAAIIILLILHLLNTSVSAGT